MVLSFNDLRFHVFCCSDNDRRRDVKEESAFDSHGDTVWIKSMDREASGEENSQTSTIPRLRTPQNSHQTHQFTRASAPPKKSDSSQCITTSSVCARFDVTNLRCPINGNIFQYAKCTPRQIAKHIHGIELFERQWKAQDSSVVERPVDRSIIMTNRISALRGMQAPQMLLLNVTHLEIPFTFTDVEVGFSDSIYYNGTDGFMGLGFSFLNGSWNEFVNHTSGMWALDVQRDTTLQSNLLAGIEEIESHIVNILSLPVEQIQWSDRMHTVNDMTLSEFRRDQQYEVDLYLYSTVYNMRICGAYLFSNYSSYWPLMINTHIEGVVLPESFYHMVMSWLQVAEGESVDFNSWDASTSLPALTFQLTPDEENGATLTIPLADLVDLHHNGTLHLYKHDDIYTYSGMNINSVYPSIQVGTRFLERYLVIVDMARRRTGFLEKLAAPSSAATMKPGEGLCLPRAQCHKLQNYYESTNACLEPACYFYIIQLVNTNTHQCEVRIEVYIVLSLMMVSMLCLECCVIQCHKRVARPLVRHSRRRVVIHS